MARRAPRHTTQAFGRDANGRQEFSTALWQRWVEETNAELATRRAEEREAVRNAPIRIATGLLEAMLIKRAGE